MNELLPAASGGSTPPVKREPFELDDSAARNAGDLERNRIDDNYPNRVIEIPSNDQTDDIENTTTNNNTETTTTNNTNNNNNNINANSQLDEINLDANCCAGHLIDLDAGSNPAPDSDHDATGIGRHADSLRPSSSSASSWSANLHHQHHQNLLPATEAQEREQRDSLDQLSQLSSDKRHRQRRLASQSCQPGQTNLIVRRFQKFDASALSCAPSPDVKIGQRVAYKEYYGNEFGTIRWIGRVPQVSPDWTVGVEFDNAIGEGDGSLNGRRYFIAKDCFAKFLPLAVVALVDQHVGRPEPGTMISVMSAAVRPGQMISIQRVSTVHVQHCFLNAPHQRPGAEFLAVNTRLHCQCPNCGPCAHVVKPPRTQRLLTPKNATHMCQFSTYTCCGMESSDEALCTYTGNKISSLPPPPDLSGAHYGRWPPPPPMGNSWMDGSGHLSQLQAEQQKLVPEEYRLGAAPEDTLAHALLRRSSSGRRRARSRQEGVAPTGPQIIEQHHQLACDPLLLDTAHSRPGSSPSGHAHTQQHRHRHRHRHKHRRKHDQDSRRNGSSSAERAAAAAAVSPVYANLVAGEPIEMQSSCGGARNPNSDIQRRDDQFQEAEALTKASTKAADNNGGDDNQEEAQQNGSAAKLNDSLPKSGANNSTDEFAPPEHQQQQQQQQRPLKSHETTRDEQFDYEPPARDVNGVDDVRADHCESRRRLAQAAADLDEDELRGPAVVQHRDSIENRYLFPTDDIIDSTLEADLETLSQARYGRFGRPDDARSSVSNCSSEENLRRRWPAIRLARKRWKRGRRRRRRSRQSGDNQANNQGRHRAPHGSEQRRRAGHRRAPSGGGSSVGEGGAKRHRGRHSGRNRMPPTGRSGARARSDEHDGGDYEQVFSDDDDDNDGNDGSYRRHRYLTSRNIILKGLRSLVVSCLSAGNHQRRRPSACSTPTGSSHHRGNQHACGYRSHRHHHHHHQHRQHLHTSGPSAISGRCRSAGWRCCELANPPGPFGAPVRDCDDDDLGGGGGGLGPVQPNSETTLAGQLEQLQLGKAAAAFIADSPHAYDGGAHLEAAVNHYVNLDHPARCHQREDKIDANLGPDCGQPLIEWHCCQVANWSHQHQHQQQQQMGERAAAWLQISSSSDCGFSSASQNSMNLTTNNSNRSSNDSNAQAADEQRRLVAIYRRLATRLTGNSDSHDKRPERGAELLRLKRALVELHSEACASCRAHTNCNCQRNRQLGGSPQPPTNGVEAEQSEDAHANRQETTEGTTTTTTSAAMIQQMGPTCESPPGRGADQNPTGQNFAAQSNCGLKLSAADQTGC